MDAIRLCMTQNWTHFFVFGFIFIGLVERRNAHATNHLEEAQQQGIVQDAAGKSSPAHGEARIAPHTATRKTLRKENANGLGRKTAKKMETM